MYTVAENYFWIEITLMKKKFYKRKDFLIEIARLYYIRKPKSV